MQFSTRKSGQNDWNPWLSGVAVITSQSCGIRRVSQSYHRRTLRRIIRRALASPSFPRVFVARNLRILADEPRWQRLPMRVRKVAGQRLLLQRSRFFLELVAWRRGNSSISLSAESSHLGNAETIAYCDHCGACCEIASGLAEFPAGTPLPARWLGLFGAGLGRWHRFCPFLWQRPPRGSQCAIHPWRPLPCRAFEQDECDYLKKAPLS